MNKVHGIVLTFNKFVQCFTKGHTYIKKTFTKGSIMEFFWTLRGRGKEKAL